MALSMICVVSSSITPLCPDIAGRLNVQSSVALSLPGKCFIWNLYIKKSLWFFMSSRGLSKKIFIKGLWSTVTNSLGHPNMNIRQGSSLYTSANASPSTGMYHDSASLVNQEPARIKFQWSLPQVGPASVAQLQCFWNRKYPIPVLLKSVDSHVGLLTSNAFTPFSISCTILCFEFQISGQACCPSRIPSPLFFVVPRKRLLFWFLKMYMTLDSPA